MWQQAQGTKKVVEGSNVYDWPCFLFANAMTVLTVDFGMAFWFLFNYAIQGKFITWLENSCDIGFRVQFNVEFPRQVMKFPIV